MHLATKVVYNTIIQVISKIITTVLGLAAVFMMTRYLGKTGFGEYTTIITFLSFFGIMADLGLTLVTVQMISRPGVDERKILNNLFTLRLLSAVIILGIAPLVAYFFPYEGAIKLGMIIAVFSFLFIAQQQILVAVFQKYLRMDKAAIAETIGRIILVAGVFISVRNNYGLPGIMAAVVAGSAINFLTLWFFARRYSRLGLAFDFSLWREIIGKSWPLALTIIFNLLYLKTDTLILSLVKTQAEVGIYGAAYKVVDILTMVPFMFAGVILPILTADWASGDKERFTRVTQKSFDLMAVLAVPLVVGAQFLAGPVMIMVAGDDFASSGTVLKILMAAAGLVFISAFLSHVIVALGLQKKIIGAYLFTAITSVAGYLIFIPRYSYFGAAAVTVYSEATIAALMFFYVARYAGFWPRLGSVAKSIGAAAVMAALLALLPISYYARGWGLIAVLLGAPAVYFLALFFFRGISRRDILYLLNKRPEEEGF